MTPLISQHRLYFHGGARGLQVGDELLPAADTGASGAYARQYAIHRGYRETPFAEHYRPDRVYLAIDPAAAAKYAGLAPGCDNHNRGCECPPDPHSRSAGDVYVVQPIGELEPEGPGIEWPGFARAPRARVVDVIEPSVDRWVIDLPLDPDAPWFHGGTPGLQVGDQLLPADVIGMTNGITVQHLELVEGLVFFTQHLETAAYFAAHHWAGSLGHGGDVYEVEPLSALVADPIRTRLDGLVGCATSARIVDIHRRAVPRIGHENNPKWITQTNAIRRREGLDRLRSDSRRSA